MDRFEDISEQELASMVKNQTDTSLIISEGITRFQQEIPQVDFSKAREVSPTEIIYSPKAAAEILAYTADDDNGKYIRFVVSVYWAGGKIYYKQLGEKEYEMRVKW